MSSSTQFSNSILASVQELSTRSICFPKEKIMILINPTQNLVNPKITSQIRLNNLTLR